MIRDLKRNMWNGSFQQHGRKGWTEDCRLSVFSQPAIKVPICNRSSRHVTCKRIHHVLRKIRQEERNNIGKVPAQNGEQDLGGESCSPVE
jgi:hypothetical protein